MDGLTDQDVKLAGMILIPDKFKALIREMIEVQCQLKARSMGLDEAELLSYVETSDGFPVPPSLELARVKLQTALRTARNARNLLEAHSATTLLIEQTLELLGVPNRDKGLRG